jgi:hypothetical protein
VYAGVVCRWCELLSVPVNGKPLVDNSKGELSPFELLLLLLLLPRIMPIVFFCTEL